MHSSHAHPLSMLHSENGWFIPTQDSRCFWRSIVRRVHPGQLHRPVGLVMVPHATTRPDATGMLRFDNDTFVWCLEGEAEERRRLLQTPTFATQRLDRRLTGTTTGHAEVDQCVKIDFAGPTKEFIVVGVANMSRRMRLRTPRERSRRCPVKSRGLRGMRFRSVNAS